jgi:hypothetical protein
MRNECWILGLGATSRFVAKTKHGKQAPANERHRYFIPVDDRQVALGSSARRGVIAWMVSEMLSANDREPNGKRRL